MLGFGHPHEPRVRRLLEAVVVAVNRVGFPGFGDRRVALEVVLRCAGDPPSDATNYLGGIADVLEAKGHRGRLDHLGDLASVALYDIDLASLFAGGRPSTSNSMKLSGGPVQQADLTFSVQESSRSGGGVRRVR